MATAIIAGAMATLLLVAVIVVLFALATFLIRQSRVSHVVVERPPAPTTSPPGTT